jgi:type I restriction enzyme S subunit
VVARIEELSAQIHEARTLRQQATAEGSALEKTASNKRFREITETEPLGNLIAEGTTISYGVLVPGPEVEDGIPFIRIQDLSVRNPPVRPAKRISPAAERPYARTRLKGGEVLLAVVGATIGKVGIAPDGWRGANIARAVCRIVPGSKLDRDFLVHVLQSQQAQDYFRTATRTLAQPTLNVGQLELTQIPLPPLPEQRRIVAELDALQAEVDALKRLQAETAAELAALLPALLDRAFHGEL